jgi:hypothetical protein
MRNRSILISALMFLAASLVAAQDRQPASGKQASAIGLTQVAYYGPQDRDRDRDRDRDHDRDDRWDNDRDRAWHREHHGDWDDARDRSWHRDHDRDRVYSRPGYGGGGWRGRLSAEDQGRFNSYYDRWMQYRSSNNAGEMRSMEGRMRDVYSHYGIPANVPFGEVAGR